MRERSILFSASMVRAILARRKTQTRRLVKYHPMLGEPSAWCAAAAAREPGWMRIIGDYSRFCHVGQPGDRLWVREEHYRLGHWEPVPTQRTRTGRQKWRFVADSEVVLFDAHAPAAYRKGRHHKDPSTPAWHKRLARFMPRRLARLLLEVDGVRVERLQDISEEDARAEGVDASVDRLDGYYTVTALDQFEDLWDSIHGSGAWDANDWVWAVSFKVLEVRHA